MQAKAYAKINLTLEVIGRRADGYHEIASVLQMISLYDTLSLDLAGELTLRCEEPELAGEGNLVMKAAQLLKDVSRTPLGVTVGLEKRIPLAAGLGGGSSDAAAALLSLARLWRLHISRAKLRALAAQLGSDVPFFIGGPTASVSGRGEVVVALRSPQPTFVVLAVPVLGIPGKTGHLYSLLTPADYSDGARTRALVEAISSGRGVDPALLVNSFERVALREFPVVAECREMMAEAGAAWSLLAGSGPARFTLFREEARAREVYGRLRVLAAGRDIKVFLAETLGECP